MGNRVVERDAWSGARGESSRAGRDEGVPRRPTTDGGSEEVTQHLPLPRPPQQVYQT